MVVVAVVVVVVWLGVWFFVSGYMSEAAERKGYTDIHAFAIVFWLGIPGCLYIIALPDLKVRENQEKIIQLLKEQKELPNRSSDKTAVSHSNTPAVEELPDL